MATGTLNFSAVKRGDTIKAKSFTFTNTTSGAAINVSAALMQFRTSSGRLVHEPTLSISGNVVTMEKIAASTTDDFPIGTLYYDLQITDTNGDTFTYIGGTLSVVTDYSYV